MNAVPAEIAIIEEEERILAEVLSSLQQQFSYAGVRLADETRRARELTSRLVAARRDVDKQMLASDEAVSHQLAETKGHEIKDLKKLLDSPYFARVVVEEERHGRRQRLEYKLGIASNLDCRIIDWRKAPIARLYYHYQEGEEYSELIQGKERNGTILYKRKLEIKGGELKRISSGAGSFIKQQGTWVPLSGGFRSRTPGNYAELPNILSLITQDQFDLITKDASSPVFIHGIAGSGKTTVALHRLAWLLHEENSDLKPEECLVLVASSGLKNYIADTLPGMGIAGVPVQILKNWTAVLAARAVGIEEGGLRRPDQPPPPGVRRVKRSLALLLALEDFARRGGLAHGTTADIVAVLSRPDLILPHDETGLLDRDLILQARKWTENCLNRGEADRTDDALLLRIHQLRHGGLPRDKSSKTKYRHIVVDEIQDLSAAELAVIVSGIEEKHQLTLVGDPGQTTTSAPSFPGWQKLREHWSVEMSDIVSLTVSHRSTYPIMKFADYVSGMQRTTDGRKGRAPLWIRCRQEQRGVREALGWLERVMERYPGAVIAVICRHPADAHHVVSLLRPTFGEAARVGDEDSFALEEGIIAADVLSVRGLEFPHVLLWNPSGAAYPDKPRARNLLYVACTRAEENLCLITWGRPSALLPPPYSTLVRLHEPETDDEEEDEEKRGPGGLDEIEDD